MKKIAQLPIKDREALFRNTAARLGITEAIVEKDFWVCWTIDYLFHRCRWKENLAFKGGTSLSKAYGLIERFSEDIDLILDWQVLGYDIGEPWIKRSNSKQDIFNKEANAKAEDFLLNTFLPQFKSDITSELFTDVLCYIDPSDRQTIRFAYPSSYSDSSILKEIRLEIGALAAWTPARMQNVTPYVAQQYSRLFTQPSTEVRTVLPERTFWEKITILHREAYRPINSEFPSRYSRHYYDVYCMLHNTVKEKALANRELLHDVVSFKDKFYHCPWARYDLADFGSMKLMPPKYNTDKLYDDYSHMQNMIWGRRPGLEEILIEIQIFEKEMNS